MPADLYRYKHKHYEMPEPEHEYSLDDLRYMLRGKTWEQVVKMSIESFGVDGVHFTARMGTFMRRKVICVCALNQIVAMRFIEHNRTMTPNWTFEAVIDGSNHSGFVILPGDFINGRLGEVKQTDLVIDYTEGKLECATPHTDV